MPRGDGQAPVPGNPTKGVSMRSPFRRRMISASIGVAAAASLVSAGALGLTQASASPVHAHFRHSPASVPSEPFGTAPAGPYNPAETVYRYTLTNAHGVQVRILTYGGIVQSINVPDRSGHSADVVLGFKTLKEYVNEVSPPPKQDKRAWAKKGRERGRRGL